MTRKSGGVNERIDRTKGEGAEKNFKGLVRRLAVCAIALQLANAGCADKPAAARTSSAADAGHARTETKSCRPEYPAAALRARAEGDTVVRIAVEPDGAVSRTEILHSAGSTAEHQLLDQAAALALANCPFTPGRDKTGKPVGATVDVTYRWLIDEPRAASVPATPR